MNITQFIKLDFKLRFIFASKADCKNSLYNKFKFINKIFSEIFPKLILIQNNRKNISNNININIGFKNSL